MRSTTRMLTPAKTLAPNQEKEIINYDKFLSD
uniref:Uncharacterized protein n=1 Tax=Aegilops tauschii subsp. strangulata TaxID=200361 RepID=A0A453MC69_AEGTS